MEVGGAAASGGEPSEKEVLSKIFVCRVNYDFEFDGQTKKKQKKNIKQE